MAKLHQEIIVLKISKLLRDSDEDVELVTNEVLATLEQVAGELTNGLIEIERA